MACISKLASAIAYDCNSGATGLVSALIINKADIVSYTADSSGLVSAIKLSSGAKACKIDTVKRTLVMTTTLKINEGAPNAFSHSASIILTGATGVYGAITSFSNGSFVILAKINGSNVINAYGMYYGLSAKALERSTHDNAGWASATLETPENVIGEDNLFVAGDVYNTLYAAAVG
jgi:hypothetical protein|nr:MAG TPA: hypothetical protein [Caudoviricetes sp.]